MSSGLASEQPRGSKRKYDSVGQEQESASLDSAKCTNVVAKQVKIIEDITASFGPGSDWPIELSTTREAVCSLAFFSNTDEGVEGLLQAGAVQALVPVLTLFSDYALFSADERVEVIVRQACLILGQIARNRLDQQCAIINHGGLRGLVGLLERYGPSVAPADSTPHIVDMAAFAIRLISDPHVRGFVRLEGGIPPLVALLHSTKVEVQRAAAKALKALTYREDFNKIEVVDCGALPLLIRILSSDDVKIQDAAVHVAANLVYLNMHIKEKVLDGGALQPVVGLLSSPSGNARGKAALVLSEFAKSPPPEYGLDVRAAIVQEGGVPPLLKLLSKPKHNQQYNAVLALQYLAHSERIMKAIIRAGGVRRLRDCKLMPLRPATKLGVQKLLERLEQKMQEE